MRKALKKLFKKLIPEPKEVISTVLDRVFITQEEKEQAHAVIEKLKNNRHDIQAVIDEFKAQHGSLLKAGWRPFIGWVCGFALANTFVINPLLQWLFGIEGPELSLDVMIEVVITLLGLGTLRTVEKLGNAN